MTYYILFVYHGGDDDTNADIDGPFFFSSKEITQDFFCEYVHDLYMERVKKDKDWPQKHLVQECKAHDNLIRPTLLYDFVFMKDLLDRLNKDKLQYTFHINPVDVDAVKTRKHKNSAIYKKVKMIK